jgi:DNA integrity scanning protein DisA with diadenylate cyclase activity
MNASKIVVPSSVASAIRHYTDLADTKSEAFTDILSMGFEGARSEVILRHFDGNHDELMEALICGYEVAQTPEDKVRDYYNKLNEEEFLTEYDVGVMDGIKDTLNNLGIQLKGVNA